jgi:hypothetical protein
LITLENICVTRCVGRVLVPLITLLSSSSLAPGEAGKSVFKTACSAVLGGGLLKTSDDQASGKGTGNAVETIMSPEVLSMCHVCNSY